MRRILTLLTLAIALNLCLLGLIACGECEHSFTNYVSDNNATCLEDGTKTATCDNGCGIKDTVADTDSKLGHKFTNYVSDNNATCEQDGTKTAVCDKDGCEEKDTITDIDSKLGHSFTTYVSDNNATCEQDGTKTAVCDKDGCEEKDTITDIDSKLGHWLDSIGCKRCDFKINYESETLGIDPFKESLTSQYPFRQNDKMPTISIDTDNGEDIVTKDYIDCKVSISNCEEKYFLSEVVAEIKVRGNATATYPKKPFRIKFDKKQTMLGLNDDLKAKSWVLLAEYGDYTMFEQSLGLYLGNAILEEDNLYCSDFMHVNVCVNGEYRGVYLLVEQQQVNSGRVDINEPEEDYIGTDIGYFFELDGYYYNEAPLENFVISYEHPLKLADGTTTLNFMQGYSIKSDIYSENQRLFIAKITKNIYDILYDATYLDHTNLVLNPYKTLNENGDIINDTSIKTAKEAVDKVVNIQSLVDMYILYQIIADADSGWSSFLLSIDMSKDGDKKLTFEAPWDFEHCFGDRNEPEKDVINEPYNTSHAPMALSNPWLMILSNESWFKKMVYEKWTKLKENGLFVGALELLETNSEKFQTEFSKNFEIWYETPNYTPDNISRLTDWLNKRANFLNAFFSTFVDE